MDGRQDVGSRMKDPRGVRHVMRSTPCPEFLPYRLLRFITNESWWSVGVIEEPWIERYLDMLVDLGGVSDCIGEGHTPRRAGRASHIFPPIVCVLRPEDLASDQLNLLTAGTERHLLSTDFAC
jgi:hypothetical protein